MKKRVLLSLALALGCGAPVMAQFVPAGLPEFYNPAVANAALNPSNTNCHSYGNMLSNGNTYDLLVHSFDGVSGSTYTWGLGWTLHNQTSGTTVNGYITNPITGAQVIGTDVAIVQENNGTIQFAVAFYRQSVGFYVAYFNLNTGTNTVSLANTTLLMAGTNNPTSIHIDVNERKDFVITFGLNNRVYACAGQVTTGPLPVLGNVVVVDNGGFQNLYPDAALCNTPQGLMTHFVYKNLTNNTIEEAVVPFGALLSGAGVVPGTVENVVSGYGFYDNRPRIDCPDHAGSDQYSFVVATNQPQYILAGIKDVAGSNFVYPLNDGSLPPTSFSLINYKNWSPVVAYDVTTDLVHYAWVFSGIPMQPGWASNVGYAGVDVFNGNSATNPQYFQVETSGGDNIIYPSRAVALSGQNDESPEMYVTMTHKESTTLNDYINCKTVPWGPGASYRTTGVATTTMNSLKATVFPNPSATGFKLAIENSGDKQLHASLTDVAGRRLFTTNGDLSAINDGLYNASQKLSAGVYFISLSADGEKGFQQLKVVKE